MGDIDSIASCTRSCVKLFQQLRDSSQSPIPEAEDQLSLQTLNAQDSRFNLWARNIAALHPAYLPSSLEHRIRDDESALKIVKSALRYVEESLEMALSILSGDKPNEIWDVESESTGETFPTQQTSELTELSLAIDDGIANLFQLSMIIRKKPETDEYLKAASKFPMPSDIDIIRVGDKFPVTNDGPSWLKERLGQAITRRRQYLLARKYHQEKMQQVHEIKVGADGKTIWTGEKASTYHPKERLQEHDPETTDLQQFQQPSRIFQTEYADSSIGRDGNSDILRTPLLPKQEDGTRFKYGEHFECPYCRRMQKFEQKSAWKKHVFSDLRPYVCTFEPCGLNMFESQHQWFDHELQFHRPQYACLQCPSPPHLTRPGLQSHYKEKHFHLSVSIDDILDKSKLSRVNASSCPLCQEYGAKYMKINQSTKCDVSLKQFQKHLGDHMEQLALAALPPDDTEDEEQETDEELENVDKESLGLSDQEKGDEDIDVKVELKKLERKDYYQILGIKPDADVSHIRDAFAVLSLKYQVERDMESGLGDKETDKRLNEIREAYATLGNSSLRLIYDRGDDVFVEVPGENELKKKMDEGSRIDPEILAPVVSNPHYKHPSNNEEFGIRDSCPIYGLPLNRLEVYLTRKFSDFWMMLPTHNDELYCFEIPRLLSSEEKEEIDRLRDKSPQASRSPLPKIPEDEQREGLGISAATSFMEYQTIIPQESSKHKLPERKLSRNIEEADMVSDSAAVEQRDDVWGFFRKKDKNKGKKMHTPDVLTTVDEISTPDEVWGWGFTGKKDKKKKGKPAVSTPIEEIPALEKKQTASVPEEPYVTVPKYNDLPGSFPETPMGSSEEYQIPIERERKPYTGQPLEGEREPVRTERERQPYAAQPGAGKLYPETDMVREMERGREKNPVRTEHERQPYTAQPGAGKLHYETDIVRGNERERRERERAREMARERAREINPLPIERGRKP